MSSAGPRGPAAGRWRQLRWVRTLPEGPAVSYDEVDSSKGVAAVNVTPTMGGTEAAPQ